MRTADWLTILVALVAGILIPTLVLVARASRRSGVIEQKLDDLAASEGQQNERINKFFEAMDRRLRWLEERVWRRGQRGGGGPPAIS